jgi:hypothetical protein
MISEGTEPGGKKRRTIKNITDDLTRGAWNNLDLSRSSKAAINRRRYNYFIGALLRPDI